MRALLQALATLGPVGYFPVAPASAASAVVVLIGWFIPPSSLPVALALIAAGAAVAVWASGEAEKTLGHDAKSIVADEVVGQSLALLLVPRAPIGFAAAFVLFRLFDVWKPAIVPVGKSDELVDPTTYTSSTDAVCLTATP